MYSNIIVRFCLFLFKLGLSSSDPPLPSLRGIIRPPLREKITAFHAMCKDTEFELQTAVEAFFSIAEDTCLCSWPFNLEVNVSNLLFCFTAGIHIKQDFKLGRPTSKKPHFNYIATVTQQIAALFYLIRGTALHAIVKER
jgi:hypothetical protein